MPLTSRNYKANQGHIEEGRSAFHRASLSRKAYQPSVPTLQSVETLWVKSIIISPLFYKVQKPSV